MLAEFESLPPWSRTDDAATILECPRQRFTGTWNYGGVYRAWREASLRNASLSEIRKSIETWASVRTAAALKALAEKPCAVDNTDVTALSQTLSVIFLRLLESNGPERMALAETVVAIVQYALFSDRDPTS